MGWKNTQQGYGYVAKWFHWVVGLLILCLLLAGFYMRGLDASPLKISIYGLHKSFGTVVFALVVLRLSWRLINQHPLSLPTHAAWEKLLAKVTHFLLYGAILLMPLSGWIMSSAGGHPYSFFGLFPVPSLTGKDENLLALMREVHEITAFTIIAMVMLHIAGALKHHFIDRDKTLQRMTSRNFGFKSGVVLTMLVALAGGTVLLLAGRYVLSEEDETPRTQVQQNLETQLPEGAWVIDRAASRIAFQATQYGEAFDGTFGNFDGVILFDPDDLEHSKADITIDITSIRTGSDDRDGQALGAEWFDTERFPQAHFTTTHFERINANHYVAQADLSIRGISKQVELPFALTFTENQQGGREANMIGTLSLQRGDYGVGRGQWESGEAIGNTVVIMINLRAAQP